MALGWGLTGVNGCFIEFFNGGFKEGVTKVSRGQRGSRGVYGGSRPVKQGSKVVMGYQEGKGDQGLLRGSMCVSNGPFNRGFNWGLDRGFNRQSSYFHVLKNKTGSRVPCPGAGFRS